MKAFYFATEERKLRYNDGRAIIVGETHTVDCEPIPCKQGLHASKRLLDALWYAPGSILYLVELGGQIVETSDKVCASSRTYLAEFDATQLLIKFACQCALEEVEQIRPYAKNYDLIVEFLKRPTARAAHAAAAYAAARAAYAAADDAADGAADDAADGAAYAAARAAYAAARAVYAADDAAYAAARAAYAAARAVYAAARAAYAAADDAADGAADDAVRANQNLLLTKLVKDATGWDI